MFIEKIVLSKERNVTLTAMIQDVGGEYRTVTERPGIIVIPGGGYSFCSDREAEPVAMAFLNAGFDAFILRYSVGKDAVWPRPLEDYDEAMALIRERAEEWHVMADKIAVVGFSAGGHLAGAAATMAKNRPAAAILGYAVLNEDVRGCSDTAPDVTKYVDYDTCPCFLFATRTDSVVPIMNTVDMMAALAKNDVSFESHVYSFGPHGFSTAEHVVQAAGTAITERAADWVQDSIGWLKEILGDFGTKGFTKPVCKPHVSDDKGAWLSIDCSIGRLFGNPVALEVLEPVIAEMKEKIQPFSPEMTFDDMMQVLGTMKLSDLLKERGIAVEKLDAYDEQLGKLPNI
ncbi:MAG: alpha/beta hydrolase [Lachnospiraceae bacterium]|nr:alpha/beta hydrolase [Lachnospiraceae bacterium]